MRQVCFVSTMISSEQGTGSRLVSHRNRLARGREVPEEDESVIVVLMRRVRTYQPPCTVIATYPGFIGAPECLCIVEDPSSDSAPLGSTLRQSRLKDNHVSSCSV